MQPIKWNFKFCYIIMEKDYYYNDYNVYNLKSTNLTGLLVFNHEQFMIYM